MSSLDSQNGGGAATGGPRGITEIPAGYDKRLMIASGRASLDLGAKIADRLEVDLTDAGLKTFSDGEVYCRYADSIRGADLFIVQSLCGSEREGLTVNDALMELLLMVHAAKHASAHRIIAVTPWYGYSRQDKKSAPREPISARLVAELLETAGIDRLVTMDLHAGQMQGFFSKPVDHMTAMPILTQYVKDQLGTENLVIIAPDAGRVKLVRKFAQKLDVPYALLEKERPAHQVAKTGYVIGEVEDQTAVIVDDIIDTGGTLAASAQTVMDEGAKEVYAVATHGVFSGQAFETLAESPLSGIVVTDTVSHRDGCPGEHQRAHRRGHPHGLRAPDLHRRLGLRDLPGREPALLSGPAARARPAARRPRSLHWPTAMADSTRPSLQVQERPERGSRETRRLRRAGLVPGVLYGGSHDETVTFKVGRRELRSVLVDGSALIDVKIGGEKSVPAIIKEQQIHPVRGEVMHIDFLEVNLDEKIGATVAVELEGAEEAPGVKEGGVLDQVTRELNIMALPTDIPERIVVDVSHMDIGSTLSLSEVTERVRGRVPRRSRGDHHRHARAADGGGGAGHRGGDRARGRGRGAGRGSRGRGVRPTTPAPPTTPSSAPSCPLSAAAVAGAARSTG